MLIRLILSPKLCSWEVSAMSSLLSPAEPCSCGNHWAECIHCFIWPSASGLNWDLGWWAKDWTAMQKEKKREIKKKKKRGRVAFTMQSEASFKMSCLGVGTAITGHGSPGVQLPSTFVLMSSSIHLQSHPSWPGSPIPWHPFIREAMTPHYESLTTETLN